MPITRWILYAVGATRGREVAITLAPTTTRDADVTDLKRMFGEAKKVVSIVEMNAAMVARGASD